MIERAYFSACLMFGRLLRAGRYSKTRIVRIAGSGECRVQKRRLFYAPFLICTGGGVMKLLDAGVRVLPRRDWEDRERQIYGSLYGTSVHAIRRGRGNDSDGSDATDDSDASGTLILPWLSGETLASLLEDPTIAEPARNRMIERAVTALAEFHRLGWTHGDAMAENVMIDVDAGVARWFDFETIHESTRPRPTGWQRADDVRALLATCLIRTGPERRAETLRLILDVYADDEVTRRLVECFATILQRPLTYHLAQAPLSIQAYRQIARFLSEYRRPSVVTAY